MIGVIAIFRRGEHPMLFDTLERNIVCPACRSVSMSVAKIPSSVADRVEIGLKCPLCVWKRSFVVPADVLLDGLYAHVRGLLDRNVAILFANLDQPFASDFWVFDESEKPAVCPDCKGTGTYVGFLEIEPCRTCVAQVPGSG